MPNRPFPFTGERGSLAVVPRTLTDEHAFTDVVARQHDELQRHCARLLGSPADAEDALQETLLRAWRSRRTVTSDCPRAWLHRIATNVCFDTIRRRDPSLVSLDDPDQGSREPAAPPEQRPDATLVARETVELALLTAIQHLPPLQQSAWVMRDVLSWSAKETASALSTSLPATNSALQRARTGLRVRFAPGRLQWACTAPCPAERRTLTRYLSAIDAPSTQTATRLLVAQDATRAVDTSRVRVFSAAM
jgi:RNA polymerase sigma-70 factor (ECF subfamily)